MTMRLVMALLLYLTLVVGAVSAFPNSHVVTKGMPISQGCHSSLQMAALHSNDMEPPRQKRMNTIVRSSSLPISSFSPTPFHVKAQNFASSALSKIRNVDEVTMWRIAAATFVFSVVMFRPILDASLIQVWNYLQTSPALLARCFRHDHWEWMLAVSAFFVWIHGFWAADRLVVQAGKEGRVHPWRKYRLQDRFEAQKFQREQARKAKRGELVDMNAQPNLVTKPSEWNWKAWIFELPLYVVPLFLWDYFIPRRAAKIATWSAPTAFQVCRDVSCGLLLYDAFFFCGHFLMHKIPFIYNTVHKKHHTNPECRAAEIVRLSFVEEVLEVGMSIVALNYLGAHPVSRSIYNVIITFLLTELHCGFDLPWTPQNVVPFGLATGSRRHHYHHRIGKNYYQKFFCHVDRLFGFYQKDDGSLNGDSVQEFNSVPQSWAN
jgi:sterol desaturase/sphingolipid hydroxylase (fatty acid hydroxylase superfamily)